MTGALQLLHYDRRKTNTTKSTATIPPPRGHRPARKSRTAKGLEFYIAIKRNCFIFIAIASS
jgi:hypothetical protein